jgi:two-component system LytT family response regulator
MTHDRGLRVLVADDEPLARAKLKHLLGGEPDVEIVSECRDGLEVMKALAETHPDLVFLDIQMPQMTGLEVVRAIGVDNMPRTIFVTAFGDFAVEAFELHAMDYLMKPFDEERFRRALARARKALLEGRRLQYETELRAFLNGVQQPEYAKRFLVKRSTEYLFVRTGDIDWIESSDNYVTLHTANGAHLLKETLANLQERLDPHQFVRIRASAIVNLERVASIRPWSSTEFQFVLHDGTTVLSSRRYRDRIRTIIP